MAIGEPLGVGVIKEVSGMRILMLGATGTIGQATVQALLSHGHEVVCVVRQIPQRLMPKPDETGSVASPALIWHVADPLHPPMNSEDAPFDQPLDAIVSCMASRSGMPKDAWAVDCQAHLDWLAWAKSKGVKQFVVLSAICVQKPKLAFQHAKLAFEKALIDSGLNYSIVRPTAFYKSLSGQVARVQQGKPFLVFGRGDLTACKPIADEDLGEFMALCLTDVHKHRAILPIGGPGHAITPLAQADMLFELISKPPKVRHVPLVLLDIIIASLRFLGFFSRQWSDKAELACIGRYYATESMLLWDSQKQAYDEEATPTFGQRTLRDHYLKLLDGEAKAGLGEHSVFDRHRQHS